MITRGQLIGELVDELASLSAQVKMRNALGLTDLNVVAEQFFAIVLNAVLRIHLVSLNAQRSNEPGLDLGDASDGTAFQITSTATAEKVNQTLAKVTVEQAGKFKKIFVLVIGKRQSSYKLDDALAKRHDFTTANIWDLDDVARRALSMDIDELARLLAKVRSELKRVRIELEVPDEEGRYPTSDYDRWESRPASKIGDGSRFIEFSEDHFKVELSQRQKDDVRRAISEFAGVLAQLPRVTREFLATMFERREQGRSRRSPDFFGALLILPKVERQYRGDDPRGELGLLEHAGLVTIDGEAPFEYGPPEIFVSVSRNDDLRSGFADFVEQNGLGFRQVIGSADLSAF